MLNLIHRLGIVLKELKESRFWFTVLRCYQHGRLNQLFKNVKNSVLKSIVRAKKNK